MDIMVLATQCWLNKTYGSDSRYKVIEENGKTGWTTIYALTRALQIELGIQNTADNFGPTSQQLYTPLVRTDGICTNKYYILQGALWCKGYNTGHYATMIDGKYYIDGSFDESVENAVKKMEEDAGRANPKGIVDLNIMKALLSMDYFYSYNTSDRVKNIQTIQRYLNRNYEPYIGLKPCDGVYSRGTNTAMIYAIQAEEGLPTNVANGNFGVTTKAKCPTIPYTNGQTNYTGNNYGTSNIIRFIKLVQMGLYVNGFGSADFDGVYNNQLESTIKQFQSHHALETTGKVNLGTWLSVFISCGDTGRSALACDCATILTNAKAQTLYNAGYRYVGRYLSGTAAGGVSKALSIAEMEIAFNNGLRIFPIQQGSATYVDYFTENQAIADVNNAYQYAISLGIPEGTIIYFAVDCDPQDHQITSNIIPYFKKVYETMRDTKQGKYRIGIYGTRNACTRVSNLGYAVTSFVGDMSTGFSGNLGFKIPNNWAFDQFATVTVGTGSGQIEIDKNGFSGRDHGIGTNGLTDFARAQINLSKIYECALEYSNNNIQESNVLTLQYLRNLKPDDYGSAGEYSFKWDLMAGPINSSFCSLVNNKFELQESDLKFKDPIQTNMSYDILHCAAVLNVLLHDVMGEGLNGLDYIVDPYAGWVGDVVTFGKDIEKNNWNINDAKEKICKDTDEIYFGLEDYIADVDAINMFNMLKENTSLSLPEVFSKYFTTINPDSGVIYPSSRTKIWIDSIPSYNKFLEDLNYFILSDIFPYPFLRSMVTKEGTTQEHINIAAGAFANFVAVEYLANR